MPTCVVPGSPEEKQHDIHWEVPVRRENQDCPQDVSAIQKHALKINCSGQYQRFKPPYWTFQKIFPLAEAISKFESSPQCMEYHNSSTNTPNTFTPFVVLSEQHSGTTWLTRILRSHPWVYMWHEPFVQTTFSVEAADKFFNHICWYSRCCASQSFAGFVLQENQGWSSPRHFKKMIEFFRLHNVKVIVLERLNQVEHHLATSAILRPGKTVYSHQTLSKEFLENLQQTTLKRRRLYRNVVDTLQQEGINVLYITYEELVRTKVHAVMKVFQFWGKEGEWRIRDKSSMEDTSINWTLRMSDATRIHRTPLSERVSNYGESLKILQDHFPEGVCMLNDTCQYTPGVV